LKGPVQGDSSLGAFFEGDGVFDKSHVTY